MVLPNPSKRVQFVDGITIVEWEGMVHSLRASVMRALGHSVNWKGDRGDWRQLK